MGDFDPAIAFCRHAVELAADPVARAVAVGWLGVALRDAGQPAGAIELLEDALAQHRELSGAGGYRYRANTGIFAANLSEAYAMQRDAPRASTLAAEALAVATESRWPVAIGYAERAVGAAAAIVGDAKEAETRLRRALDTFVAIDARCQIARTRVLLAEALVARGERAAAQAELRLDWELYRRMPAPRYVERTERAAAEIGVTL